MDLHFFRNHCVLPIIMPLYSNNVVLNNNHFWQGNAQKSHGKKLYIVCYKKRINSGKRQICVIRLCIEMQLAQFLHVYFDYKAFNFVLQV